MAVGSSKSWPSVIVEASYAAFQHNPPSDEAAPPMPLEAISGALARHLRRPIAAMQLAKSPAIHNLADGRRHFFTDATVACRGSAERGIMPYLRPSSR